ncbi:hypothetical protein BYT27DRAFT_7184827 [Phlegmacium glaucopus]|nr:hypothetical protein BYT27DRAFT_7184827 [Phlegmacium glaucopus]
MKQREKGFEEVIPQAAMAAASYYRQQRGCITNGEIWVFFIFSENSVRRRRENCDIKAI